MRRHGVVVRDPARNLLEVPELPLRDPPRRDSRGAACSQRFRHPVRLWARPARPTAPVPVPRASAWRMLLEAPTLEDGVQAIRARWPDASLLAVSLVVTAAIGGDTVDTGAGPQTPVAQKH